MLRLLIPATLALTAGLAVTLIHTHKDARGPAAIELAPGAADLATPAPPTPPAPDLAPPPASVNAAAEAMLVDLSSGRTLYAHEPERRFLPASVTKVMTAFVALELLEQGRLRPDQRMTVSDRAWKEWHSKGSRMFLERGSQPTVDQLLMGITTVSANDACVVLAEGAAGSVEGWVALMNASARRLGMANSHFGTPNGWMDKGNTYYTARDLVRLADALLTRYPAQYKRYFGHEQLTWNGITQHNHDPILRVVQGADGIKTGFTNEAHYNFLGSAQRGDQRLVMVLAGVPRPAERARAARDLMEWGFSQFPAHRLFAAGERVANAEVQGGTERSVPLVAPRALVATLPRGSHAQVRMTIRYQGPLQAPIAKGAEVAQLELRVGNEAPTHVPLVAGAAVPRGGTLDRLRDGLAGIL